MKPDKSKPYRGSYYYEKGPAYDPDVCGTNRVVGRWTKDNFQLPLIFGKAPQFSIKTSHIAVLDNGKFLVRKYGMNDLWCGPNSVEMVYEYLDDAIRNFEERVEYINSQRYNKQVRKYLFGVVFVVLWLAIIAYPLIT